MVHLPAALLGRSHPGLQLRGLRQRSCRGRGHRRSRGGYLLSGRLERLVQKSAEELLPPGTKCPSCGGTRFLKENNILDVWFESGASQNILGKRDDLPWPADVYIEGHDQHRGWFNSSLLIGIGAKGRSPYKTCITHGFVLDEQGRAMSKSAGNVIEPSEIISKNGAEILRLWVAMLNYKEDAKFGNEILQRLIEAYRKIRNTWRFALGQPL